MRKMALTNHVLARDPYEGVAKNGKPYMRLALLERGEALTAEYLYVDFYGRVLDKAKADNLQKGNIINTDCTFVKKSQKKDNGTYEEKLFINAVEYEIISRSSDEGRGV